MCRAKTQVSSLCNMGEFGQNRLQQVIFRFDGATGGGEMKGCGKRKEVR